MTGIQPQLWVDSGATAVAFYEAAFGARVLHRVGDGEDVVAQLAVGEAVFWVAATDSIAERLVPRVAGGTTGRTLLVVDDPDEVVTRAVGAGAELRSLVEDQHGWRLGRIVDPFGHEWEVGHPVVPWPPGA